MKKPKRLCQGQRLKVFGMDNPTCWQTATFNCYAGNQIVVYFDDYQYSCVPLGEERKYELIPGQIVRCWQVWEVSVEPRLIVDKLPDPTAAKVRINKIQNAEVEAALKQSTSIPWNKYEVRPLFRHKAIPNQNSAIAPLTLPANHSYDEGSLIQRNEESEMYKQKGTSWEIELAHGTNDAVQKESFYGTQDEAYQWAESNCPQGWYLVAIRTKRGGKRPGSGTKAKPSGKAKVVKRISPELANKLDAIEPVLARLKDWEVKSRDASSTSPRWEQCRKLLNEINELWSNQGE